MPGTPFHPTLAAGFALNPAAAHAAAPRAAASAGGRLPREARALMAAARTIAQGPVVTVMADKAGRFAFWVRQRDGDMLFTVEQGAANADAMVRIAMLAYEKKLCVAASRTEPATQADWVMIDPGL